MEEAEAEAEAEAGTEIRAGGAGRPTAHPIGAASAAAVKGPVSGACAGQGGEPNNAGYSPEHFTDADPAAPVGGPVSARLAPSIGATQERRGGTTHHGESARR